MMTLRRSTDEFVTYEPGDPIPTDALVRYTREVAALAALGPSGRPASWRTERAAVEGGSETRELVNS